MPRVTLPGYELLRSLGRGSAGVVYLARDQVTGELVAIKHLRTEIESVVAWRRFEQEATIMRSLRHPSLVEVRDVLELGGEYVLVLEYVEGATLADALPRLDLAVGAALIEDLGRVLDVVHDAGVVHRDVKPANVLLSVGGRCKLTDFGVARFVGDSIHAGARNAIRTKTGTTLGSPAYMSPEAAAGQRDIDRRADVYSLAVIAYRLVVGQLPFTGDAYRMLQAQMNDPPPIPSELRPTLPRAVDEILLRGLAKQRALRYPTAGAFAQDFATAMRSSSGIDEQAPEEALAVLVTAIVNTRSRDIQRDSACDEEDETRESTADATGSTHGIMTLPRLPAADVPIFRPRARHRAGIVAFAIAIAIGATIGVIAVLVHH
jgi:eukaryotic-like serine/threonine-protein kinase